MAGFSVSGLGSGIDWQGILDKLGQVETSRLTPFNTQKANWKNKLDAWNTFSIKIQALQSAAYNLKLSSSFNLFSASLTSSSSVEAETLLSATASSSASKGSYQVVINNRAQVEKLASAQFSSQTTALNIEGTILVNGQTVSIAATDTLQGLATKINNMNAGGSPIGVTAGIIQDVPGKYRLVLTSKQEGAAGISLLNASSLDTLGSLGFNGDNTVIKNQVAGAATSDAFTDRSSNLVEVQLGISSQNLSGSVWINGHNVDIDLTSTLDTIKAQMVAEGISADIVEDTSGSTTKYRLKVEGMSDWEDDNNVLQALGLIEGGREDVIGVAGSIANTTNGTTPITADTRLVDIYGYLNWNSSDKITISGTRHDGSEVAATEFAIELGTTVQQLLLRIQSLFGNVTTELTSDGKIKVIDNETGNSELSVSLRTTLADPQSGVLDFGAFSNVGALEKYVLQQGKDASLTVDGLQMTSTTNTVTTAIPGVTLNLLGADPNTTVTVNVDRDGTGIEALVKKMVDAYNDVISYINTQMTYNAETKKPGGPLFGDNTLKSVKMKLQTMMMGSVGTSSIKYLADAGIKVGDDNKLKIDSTVFQKVIGTNFNDVVKLFADSGYSSNSQILFASATRVTVSGTYTIGITQAGPNIAGTIDTYAGSALNDILSLTNSASSANGLSVQYTGTGVPVTASFTFTRGFASLLEIETYNLSDSANGALALQTQGIQKNIDTLSKKITDTQATIEQRIAMYKAQFVAMDTAVTKLQSMQSYLASQLK